MSSFYGGTIGQSFKIDHFFNNRKEMLEHLFNIDIFSGQFALVSYGEKNSAEYNQNLIIDDNINYNNFLYQKTFENLEWQWKYITDLSPNDGPKGDTGSTLYPIISESGELSWELRENPTEIPASVNIRGPIGLTGEKGDIFSPKIEEGILSWEITHTPSKVPEPLNIIGPQGPPGAGLNIKPGILENADSLPLEAEEGDGYFVKTDVDNVYNLYVYHDQNWSIIGKIESVIIDDDNSSTTSVYSSNKVKELLNNKIDNDKMTWGTF